jgi:HSP20 family protein
MMYVHCNKLNDSFDAAVRTFFDNDWASQNEFPVRMDLIHGTAAFKIVAELPGMEKDHIKIMVENGILTISGERKRNEENANEMVRSERYYGSFSRSFTLPDSIDKSGISADYVNGLLEVTLPMKEEEKPKQIDIAVN